LGRGAKLVCLRGSQTKKELGFGLPKKKAPCTTLACPVFKRKLTIFLGEELDNAKKTTNITGRAGGLPPNDFQ